MAIFKFKVSDTKASLLIFVILWPGYDQMQRHYRGRETNMNNYPIFSKYFNIIMGGCDKFNAIGDSYLCYLQHKKMRYVPMVYFGKGILDANTYIDYITHTGPLIY